MKSFQFPLLVHISCVSQAIQRQAKFTLKLMRYEPNDYNNEECLSERIRWCQKFESKYGWWCICGQGWFHFTFDMSIWKGCQGQRCQRIHPTQRGRNLILVVVVGSDWLIAHDVTLGAYNTNKFIQTNVITGLNRLRFILMEKVTFHITCELQQAFKDDGQIYFHLPSHTIVHFSMV